MTDSAKTIQLNLNDRFTRSLACAAISPDLRSILVFDTTPDALRLATQTTAQMLRVVTGNLVDLIILGTFEGEDDLWGRFKLNSESSENLLQWELGLLAAGQNNSQMRLVVIPDLTKLSLAAARACVVLMGADVTHLERQGQQAHWQPNLCWLAGCASSEVGMVSPHLLDRFTIRLGGQVAKTTDRVAEILEWIDDKTLGKEAQPESLPTEISVCLKKTLQAYPEITVEAVARVIDYTSKLEMYGSRREIALARLSAANARLMGSTQMTAAHVDIAAWMMGLKKDTQRTEKRSNQTSESQQNLPQATDVELTSTISPEPPQISTVKEAVYESNEPEVLPITLLTFNSDPNNPYPEDEASVERETASLQLPPRRFRASAVAHGLIIGMEKATTIQDLALVRTLLEAAKFQHIRQQSTAKNQRRLVLLPTDLYCYRRAPVAEQMLMLVIDHTCLRNCNWQDELLPYLSWAYVERASVCLIQVGAADASHELRAEKVMAQSILVPHISAGIEAGQGKATPLAHGLDLVLQTLRHALQHGRNRVQQAVLVVISDGRGNVPLEASYLGWVAPPVRRQGVEDALQVAERIRALNGVKAVLLNPQPKQYADLPVALAKAMGATVISILPVEATEME